MKLRLNVVCAAFMVAAAVIYACQYRDSMYSYETLTPYTHVGPTAETEQKETEAETTEIITESAAESTTRQDTTEASTEYTMTEATEPTAPTVEITYPLDLNTVTFEELCSIPGIGEVTAQLICDYREQNGGFVSMEQLLEISGIGEKRFQQLRSYLYLEEVATEPYSEPPGQELEVIAPMELETEPIPVLNLNTVTKEQLMLLPECDEQLAENILYLRDELIHIFHNPLEITLAEGVTDELYFLWCPYLAVDDEGGTQLPFTYD